MFRRISAISFIYAGVLSFNTLNIQSIGSGIGLYSGLFQISILSNMTTFFILLISSLLIITWPNLEFSRSTSFFAAEGMRVKDESGIQEKKYSNLQISYNYIENSSKSNEYSLIIFFNILGALFLISSADLVSMYLSIELQSFGLYILATLYKEKYSSTSAGLKYFLLGGLSSCIILLGSGLIYSYTGLTNLESIYSIISVYFNNTSLSSVLQVGTEGGFLINGSYELKGLSLGILFIFSGFLFKIAASPFHNWAPDVYDESPTLVTIWLTIMPKISILIFLLELQIGSVGIDFNLSLSGIIGNNNLFSNDFNNMSPLIQLLLISSLLSLLIGSIVGLSQIRIKRLLAYSTISHVGFLLLSLSVFSNSSVEAFIFYIVQYTITNLNIFLIILAFGYIFRTHVQLDSSKKKLILNLSDIEYISSFKGLFYKNPLLGISLSVCLFSFAGVPPLIGFFAKQQVLYASNSAGYFFLSLIAILVSVISASYYLKIIKIMHSIPSHGFLYGAAAPHPLGLQLSTANSNSSLLSSTISRSLPSPSVREAVQQAIPFFHDGESEEASVGKNNYLTTVHSFIISVLTLIILLFIFNPELLLNCISITSSLILNL